MQLCPYRCAIAIVIIAGFAVASVGVALFLVRGIVLPPVA